MPTPALPTDTTYRALLQTIIECGDKLSPQKWSRDEHIADKDQEAKQPVMDVATLDDFADIDSASILAMGDSLHPPGR